MDSLLSLAQSLAQKTPSAILPIPKRIAYVVSHGQSYASNGYAIRTQGVAQALNQHGFETLCFVRPGRPWELQAAQKDSVTPEMIVKGVRYIHTRWPDGTFLNGNNNRLEASVEKLIELFSIYRPEVVLAASNYIVGLPAWVAAQRLGIPFYNEVRGFWELSRDAREPGYENTPAFKLEAERDTFVAQQAIQVFTLNQPMKDELVRRGVEASKIQLVPNGVSELPEIKPADPELKRRLGINVGDKVIGYVGSLSAYEGLDVLLDACTELVQKGETLKLLLVGDSQPLIGASAANIADSGLKDTPPWLIQVGRVPHEQVADYYALLDAVVIPRKPLAVCQLVPPMKAAEALAYGKRLVVSDVAPLAEYADKFDGVVSFEAGSATSLATALQRSLKLPVPQPSTELLFSAHTEPMVKALKGEGSEPASQQAFIEQPRSEGRVKNQFLKADKKTESFDERQISYGKALQWFNRNGELSKTLKALIGLRMRGDTLNQAGEMFQQRVEGLLRLKGGCPLPPKKTTPGLKVKGKHVLYCLHQSLPHSTNGYSTRSHGIAVGLQKAGWKVRATTRVGFPWDEEKSGLNNDYLEIVEEGVVYSAVNGSHLIRTPLDHYLLETTKHFINEAERHGSEIIVSASNHITALPALMGARRLGLPFVYEVRGLWEVTQASTQPEWAGSERYQLMRELEQQVALEADLVITLTEELADELASWGVHRERIEVVPNAVNSERFTPMAADNAIAKELKLKPGVPVIGYAGSAVAYEGLELLMEAMATLKKHGQAFTFVLVGDGKVIDTVKAKAKELSIEEECRFTGRVPFEQVPRYLSCMDILPIPRLSSAVTEMVSALKPLEAMAMGKALVLSDVSPHTTMAGQNGERARLFTKDSAQALSDALQTLINSPEECKRLGKTARAWIEQERTWDRVAYCYADALSRVGQRHHNLKAIESNVEKKGGGGKSANNVYKNTKQEKVVGRVVPEDFKAISIMDEISEECWKYEFTNYRINRHSYQSQLRASTAAFAFLESCWNGNGGAWQYAFTSPGLKHDNAQALLDLIPRIRKKKIPIVFWNKEDPMHYDRYLPIAKQADIIFTTDSNKVEDYRRDVPDADVHAVPFAAQQKICNPSGRFKRKPESVCFAGSYYSEGHDERKRQMHALLPSIIEFKGAIYDRFSKLGNDRYKFPDQFQPFIRDAVPFNEVVKLYKQFKVFLNVNTIVDSPTMMSRRVYELLACGTPVVSTPSKAIEEQFPGIVHMAKDAQEANKIIEKLLTDEHYWEKTSHLGYREVMTKHTYTQRLQSIKQALGYEAGENKPLVSIITCTRRPNMIDRIVENMTRQNHPNCELILMLQDFSDAQRNELLDKLKSKPSNLKYIEVIVNDSQDITLGERFNHAATYAKGEYIAKMDDDDFYFEHYLSDMLIPFSFGDYAMVGKRELFMYLSGSKKLVRRFSGMKHSETNFAAGPTFVIKKYVFDKVKFESRNTGEDSSFLKNIVDAGYKIYAADPFNFIQFRADPKNHTWNISDEELLKGTSTEIVSEGFNKAMVDF